MPIRGALQRFCRRPMLLVLLALPACLPPGPGAARSPGAAPELLVGPEDNLAGVVTAAIAAARRSVSLEIYLLTDQEVLDALAAAAERGVDVQVLLEPAPHQAPGANDGAYQRLEAAGARVAWTSARFALTHAKLLLVDGRCAYVMTANLTRAGLTANRELVAVSTDAAEVASAEQLFAADAAGARAPPPRGALVVSPEGTRAALGALLDGATRSILVEMEELSDPELRDRLAGLAAAAIEVVVVAPARDRSAATTAALAALARAGARVRTLEAPVVHAKALIVDGARGYVGSANLTTASLGLNREVGLVLEAGRALARATATVVEDATRAAPFVAPGEL